LSPPIFRSAQNIVTDKGLVIISVPRAPLFCKTLQSYNSPGARARELLKPSTDLATSSCWDRKNLFFGLGHLWVTSQVVIIAKSLQGCFCVYLVTFTQAWAPFHWAMFWLKLCLKT